MAGFILQVLYKSVNSEKVCIYTVSHINAPHKQWPWTLGCFSLQEVGVILFIAQ